jgi:hypothetical protein
VDYDGEIMSGSLSLSVSFVSRSLLSNRFRPNGSWVVLPYGRIIVEIVPDLLPATFPFSLEVVICPKSSKSKCGGQDKVAYSYMATRAVADE